MNIQELKRRIELGSLSNELLILKNNEHNFLSNQYLLEIIKKSGKSIEYIDTLDGLLYGNNDLFNEVSLEDSSIISVYKIDELVYTQLLPSKLTNVIIITNKIKDKNLETELSDYIVQMPKLEPWQIKDYVYSVAQGVDHKDLDWLITICDNNIYRLNQELEKLSLFTVSERKYLFNDLIRDGAVDDLTSYNIFNFTTAITHKDYAQLNALYQNINVVDINEFGLVKILIQNFRNIILVHLSPNPTPDNTGLDSKQIWITKKIPKVYSANQLLNIYTFLTDIDRRIKEGELPVELVRDYLLVKILSM